MQNNLKDLPFSSGKLFIVDNYLEAAGVINAIKAGVSTDAVRRPFNNTKTSDYKEKGIPGEIPPNALLIYFVKLIAL